MTRALFIILCLLPQYSKSQILVVDSLEHRYEEARHLLHPYLKEVLNHWDTMLQKMTYEEGAQPFPGFVTSVSIDTLNKDSLIWNDYSGIKITSLNGEPYTDNATTEQDEWANIHQNIWLNYSFLKEDTLYIDLGMPMSAESVQFKIHDSTLSGTYNEYYKHDTILKRYPNDSLTNEITLPLIFETFQLSPSTYSAGDIIFGFASFNVPSYYKTEYMVSNSPLNLKRKYKVYFKVEISP